MYHTFRPGGAQTGESVHERSLEMKILTWRHVIVWKFSPPKGKNFRTKPKIDSKLPTKFSLTALFRRPEDPPNPHPAAGRSQRPVRTIFLRPEDAPEPFSDSQDPPENSSTIRSARLGCVILVPTSGFLDSFFFLIWTRCTGLVWKVGFRNRCHQVNPPTRITSDST